MLSLIKLLGPNSESSILYQHESCQSALAQFGKSLVPMGFHSSASQLTAKSLIAHTYLGYHHISVSNALLLQKVTYISFTRNRCVGR